MANKKKQVEMYKVGVYTESNRMFDLISDNYGLLLVLNRFDISLGFGNKTIGEVCQINNVDTATFLAIVNLLLDEDKVLVYKQDLNVSIPVLIDYLRRSHSYYLDFRLLSIREKLVQALIECEQAVSTAVLEYFDLYVAEVRKHMMYEEDVVFPYIHSLLIGTPLSKEDYSIMMFSDKHDNIDNKLSELKDIIIKYFPTKSSNELNGVLFNIFACAQDLASHNDVENSLLVPAIEDLEINLQKTKNR